jgi:hypothetical protein
MELLTTKITLKTWGIKKIAQQYLHYSFLLSIRK